MFPKVSYENPAVGFALAIYWRFDNGVTEALNLKNEKFDEERLKRRCCEGSSICLFRQPPSHFCQCFGTGSVKPSKHGD